MRRENLLGAGVQELLGKLCEPPSQCPWMVVGSSPVHIWEFLAKSYWKYKLLEIVLLPFPFKFFSWRILYDNWSQFAQKRGFIKLSVASLSCSVSWKLCSLSAFHGERVSWLKWCSVIRVSRLGCCFPLVFSPFLLFTNLFLAALTGTITCSLPPPPFLPHHCPPPLPLPKFLRELRIPRKGRGEKF
jgi:hypothetical protein